MLLTESASPKQRYIALAMSAEARHVELPKFKIEDRGTAAMRKELMRYCHTSLPDILVNDRNIKKLALFSVSFLRFVCHCCSCHCLIFIFNVLLLLSFVVLQ